MKENLVSLKDLRKLKTKIYKYMTSVSQNVYIDKLDDIVGQYNNTYHRAIVKDDTYIDFKKAINDREPKSKAGDHVRISKYKNIFAKGYTPNWSEEVFVIKKVKNTVPWMLLMISMVKKLLEHFMKKNYKRQIKKNLG